jgi:chromosome segregation ATPase
LAWHWLNESPKAVTVSFPSHTTTDPFMFIRSFLENSIGIIDSATIMATTSNPAPTPETGFLLSVPSSVPLQQPQSHPNDDATMTTALPLQPQDVEHLQVELAEMRKAFQEYIATTQDLEVNIDMELQDMRKSKEWVKVRRVLNVSIFTWVSSNTNCLCVHSVCTTIEGKLDESTVAYETLTEKLKTMEPMLRSLELSLGGTRKRLKEEAKLRRTAEVAQVEAEGRLQDVCDKNNVLQQECEALRAELEHQNRQNDQLKREHEASRQQLEEFSSRLASSVQSRREERAEAPHLMNIDSGMGTETVSNKSRHTSPGDESYVEVLDELETVTEQLITTQQKLWRTEDLLRESEARSSSLQVDIHKLKNQQRFQESDEGLLHKTDQAHPELAQTKKELEEAHHMKVIALNEPDIESEDEDDQMEQLRDQMEEAEYRLQQSQEQLGALEMLLEESQEENIRLVEEIASLRIILKDEVTLQGSQAIMKESISKEVRLQVLKEANEVREKEISALREQFKKIFRENSELKEKMEKLENGHPSLGDLKLKKEVENLNLELLQVQDEHKKAVLEIELSWKKKMEQVTTGEFIPEDLLEEMEVEMKTAIDSAADRIRILQADKETLEDRVQSLERELEFSGTKISGLYTRLQESDGNLKASRDEILRLKKSNTHLTSELEYTARIMSRMDTECERLTRQHSELKAELEVAFQVIESAGLDQDTVRTEESIKAKEKIHRLTSNLNKLMGDYSALLNELEATRERFLDDQEEAGQQKEVELKILSDKIVQLEEAFERTKIENKDLFKKLQAFRQEQKDPTVEEMATRELQEELKAAKRSILDLENEMEESDPGKKALQTQLKHSEDALSSSRMENKRLVEEIEKIRSETSTVSRSRSSRDPDPTEQTLIRDPPSILRGARSGDSGASSLLKELTLENQLLRHKIVTSNKGSSDFSENTVDELKDQLFSKVEELRRLEENFLELQGVLRATEQKLRESERAIDQSSDESLGLRNEVKTLEAALRDAHVFHSETVHKLESTQRECRELRRLVKDTDSSTSGVRGCTVMEELELQIHRLKDEISGLQHQLDDAKIALSVSEYAQERVKEELRTSQSKLENSQASEQTLTEELKMLAGAFSDLRDDHEALLADFDSQNDKKATATENAVANDSLRIQLQRLAAENSDLQKFVSDSKQKMLENQNEIDHKSKEIEKLVRNLLTTQEEARLLSREITNLSTAFENAQTEYDAVVEELDAMQSLFEQSREAAVNTEKESSIDVLLHKLASEGEQQKRYMTEQLEKAFSNNLELQRKLHEAELSLSEAKKTMDDNSGYSVLEKENDILQQALEDSQIEIKALKDRCFQLEVLMKQPSKNADKEEDGRQCRDDKALSAVFDSAEMLELKKQFNELVEENISLEQVARQSDLALTLAKDVVEGNKKEMIKLESDLSDLKSAKLKLQEEVYNLTVELESSHEDHLAVLKEARAVIEAEAGSKAQSLQYQIGALTIENSSLRNRMQKLASDASFSYDQLNDDFMKVNRELQSALEEKNTATKDNLALQAKLFEGETSSNQQLVAVQLQNELQKVCQQKEELLAQLNGRIAAQDRSAQTDTESNATLNAMRAEYEATMEVFERINSMLASVDFLERHHEINLRTSHANLTSTSQKAEEIRRKIAFLAYAFQKEKKERSDIIFQLKSSQSIAQNKELLNEEIHRKLEDKLEATEIALKTALDSEERHKVELEHSIKKYQETQTAAKNFKEQVLSLQGIIKDSQRRHPTVDSKNGRTDSRVMVKDDDEKCGTIENKEIRCISQENKDLKSFRRNRGRPSSCTQPQVGIRGATQAIRFRRQFRGSGDRNFRLEFVASKWKPG